MTQRRPFGRLDLAILLAASVAAGWLAIRQDREVVDQFGDDWTAIHFRTGRPAISPWLGLALRISYGIDAVLVVVSLGLGLVALGRPLGLRSPRGPTPGMTAIAVGASAVAFRLAREGIAAVWDGTATVASHPFMAIVSGATHLPTGAIFGAWVVLALSRLWRREDDWPGRLGLWLGWAWMASIGSDLFRTALW